VDHPVSMPGADRENAMKIAITRDGKVYFGVEQVRSSDLPQKISDRLKDSEVEWKVYIVADMRGAAMLAVILAGARPARGTCPVATVAISGGGTGDQFTGSPEVKAPVGRAEMLGRIRQGGEQLVRS